MEHGYRSKVKGGLPLYDTNVGYWTQSPDQKRIDRDNREINRRLAEARKGGRYPGPKEAAETMKKLEKIRLHVTKERLQEEERALRSIERQNKIMLDGLAKAFQGGRLDNRWSEYFWRKNVVEVARKRRNERLAARRQLEADNVRVCLRLLKEIHSEYSRQAVQMDWPHKVHEMRFKSRFPISEWWSEYLTELASMPPKRRFPPLTVKEQLDQVTEKAHEEMKDNIAFHLTKANAYLDSQPTKN